MARKRKVILDDFEYRIIVNALNELRNNLIREDQCTIKSFKNKTRIDNPEENWAIFKNVHEPIIDRETFERVQELIRGTKRRAPKKGNGEKNIFCDILYCADCGSKLYSHVNTRNKSIHFFSCSNYGVDIRGGTCDTRHYIRADAVEQVVMMELRRLASYLKDDEEFIT